MSGSRGSDTRSLLNLAQEGNKEAMGELLARLYTELKQAADAQFRNESPGHTLQPTALVHEAYLRLIDATQPEYEDRKHFLRIAGRIMREILVDHARRRGAKKRGGDAVQVSVDNSGLIPCKSSESSVDILALHEALEELAELDQRKAQVVELRFFSGLTIKETAEVLGIGSKTVEVDWYGARAWLGRKLGKRVQS